MSFINIYVRCGGRPIYTALVASFNRAGQTEITQSVTETHFFSISCTTTDYIIRDNKHNNTMLTSLLLAFNS